MLPVFVGFCVFFLYLGKSCWCRLCLPWCQTFLLHLFRAVTGADCNFAGPISREMRDASIITPIFTAPFAAPLDIRPGRSAPSPHRYVAVTTCGTLVLERKVVDLKGRVWTIACETYNMVDAVTDTSLLNSDCVVHHSNIVDRKHTAVNLHT